MKETGNRVDLMLLKLQKPFIKEIKKKRVKNGFWNWYVVKSDLCAQRTDDFICSFPKAPLLSPVVSSMHLCFFRNNMEELCKTCNPPPSVLGPLGPLLRFSHGVVAKYFLHHKKLSSLSWERRYNKNKNKNQFLVPVLPLTYWATSRNLLVSLGTVASSAKEVDWSAWVIIFCFLPSWWWGLPPFNHLSSP